MTRAQTLMTAPGLKVGLLGGSFNPAHEGHRLVSLMAMRQLQLDQVWWLVSPQNPLKSAKNMAPLAQRLRLASEAAKDPRIKVTDIERKLGTSFTIETVKALQKRHHDLNFVWLMGADNMIQMPHWEKWQELMETIPVAVYPRPGFTLKARLSPAATTYRTAWLDTSDASLLPHLAAPALCFLSGPQSHLSATAIRAGQKP